MTENNILLQKICVATQQVDDGCDKKCEEKGNCAYCHEVAELVIKRGAINHSVRVYTGLLALVVAIKGKFSDGTVYGESVHYTREEAKRLMEVHDN